MRLRTQLLFVSLLTLVLPWAGCQYAREFESALRQNQQNTLADSAGAIAAVLAGRPALLVRDPVQITAPPADQSDDLYAATLPAFVTLDGFAGDWGEAGELRALAGAADARLAAGIDAQGIWLFVRVNDDEVIYERPGEQHFDHVLIDYDDPGGAARQLLIATAAVGRTRVRRREADAWVDEPRAQAVWEQTATGYQLEMRLRNRLVGARLGLTVIDQDRAGRTQASTWGTGRPGFLVHPLAELERALSDFRVSGRRILVVDTHGWVLATVSGPGRDDSAAQRPYPLAERLVRRIVSPPREEAPVSRPRAGRLVSEEIRQALAGDAAAGWYSAANQRTAVVVATHPIEAERGVMGAVALEQTSEAILTLTDRALTRLVTLTLAATLLAALALVGYATYLSVRIRRLSQAAEQAMSPEGTIVATLPEQRAGDEIGDLSRSFAGLLSRLREHTDYLRTLAGKLSHELRTPLAVVQSSLDNLDAAALPEEARVYSQRAREGSARLRSILTAMSEASQIEQAIAQTDPERFDLRELVAGCVAGYRDVHDTRHFELHLSTAPCPIVGGPELIAQMLDKLVDNAVDFTPEKGLIEISLERQGAMYSLSVANEGAPLPQRMQGQLFDSMVSLRSRKSTTPHLGFGLHIARLIAESHGGAIACRSLPDDSGAEFTVTLPAST